MIQLHLDLDESNLTVPGYEFFGPMGGYIDGKGVYGVWFLTSHKSEDKSLILRFSNDTGSDSQTIRLTPIDSNSIHYEVVGANSIRKVQGRKLVKVEDTMQMQLVKDKTEEYIEK